MAETSVNSSRLKADEYINAQDKKNKLILTELRRIIKYTDAGITEEVKWGMPAYSYNGLMIYLRGSKKHVTLGFYNGSLMHDPDQILEGGDNPKMRNIKISAIEELDEELVRTLIKRSMAANV